MLGIADLLELPKYLKARRQPPPNALPPPARPPLGDGPNQSFMPGESAGIPNEQWQALGHPTGGPDYGVATQDMTPLAAPMVRPRVTNMPRQPAEFLPEPVMPTPSPIAPTISAPEPAAPPLVRSSETELAPHVRDAKGMATSKPVMPTTGDPNDLELYRQDLETWRNPKGGSRWKSVLKMFGMGALRALASGQGLAGALGGGIAGGIYGAASPNIDERMWREREIERVGGLQRKQYERSKLALDTQEQLADIGVKRAQQQYTLRRPELEGDRIAALERRVENQDYYNRGRLSESAANREFKGTEGEKNRTFRSAIADKNLKYRENKDTADRALRKEMHGDRMGQARAVLAQRVKAQLATEAARKVAAGQRATAVRISAAKAKAWAKLEGVPFDDFVDVLDENDVEITDK